MFPAARPEAPDNSQKIWQISKNGQANAGIFACAPRAATQYEALFSFAKHSPI
jgi:hypothetical protein